VLGAERFVQEITTTADGLLLYVMPFTDGERCLG
jgi:hypothetical protein